MINLYKQYRIVKAPNSDSEHSEQTDDSDQTEDSEHTEDSEFSEDSEHTEDSEFSEDSEHTEDSEFSDSDAEHDEKLITFRGQIGGITRKEYVTIRKSGYTRPKDGTFQDKMSKSDIIKNLKGYTPLRTMTEKQILTDLPIFKTWVKYIDMDKKKFRVGGLLMKVEYPQYIMLVNTANKITWSVQLDKATFFIKKPNKESLTKRREQKREAEKLKQTELIKSRLYNLYTSGKLTVKK